MSRRGGDASTRRGSLGLAASIATAALVIDVLVSACHRAPAAPGADASAARTRDASAARSEHDADAAARGDTAGEFGPPNPWGDGALPPSTAHGPEADTTRATLDAVRATIGFWRVARHATAYCPNLEDLARTAGSGFDRATMEHDAWGSPIEIECQGAEVHVRSRGPDRAPGTADDLIVR